MEKKEINKLKDGQMAPEDKFVGYSVAQDELVLFPIQTENLTKYVEIHADHDIYMRSNTIDLSSLRVQILRKKKRSKIRSYYLADADTPRHSHPVERMSGWRWSKYFATIGKNNGEIGFIPFVSVGNGWYKLNLLDYLYFIKRDPDADAWFDVIRYTGCDVCHRAVNIDKPKVYQYLGLKLIDKNDSPCSDVIQIRHRITLSKIIQPNGTYSFILGESFTLK